MKKFMQNFFSCISLLFCIVLGMVSYAGASGLDTTAPVVTKVTLKSTSVNKPETFQIDFDVIEEETGIKSIQVSLYSRKANDQYTVFINTIKDYTDEDSLYSGTITLDFETTGVTPGTYYVGNILIIDNAGNKGTYFDHYNVNGYYAHNGKSYLQLYGQQDATGACEIVNGATLQVISTGDDIAPIVTEFDFATTSVAKKGTFDVKMTVIEDSAVSSIDMIFEGYIKGAQIPLNINLPISDWTQVDNIITATITLQDINPSGVYYLSQIRIHDTEGNYRYYHSDFHVNKRYPMDDNGDYLFDENNTDYRCYVIEGKTITVESDGDEAAPVIKTITLQKTTVAKPGILPIALELASADEVKQIQVVLRRNGQNEQETYFYYKTFEEKTALSSVVANFPIATDMNSDEYYLERLVLTDFAGNIRTYCAYGTDYPYLVENNITYMWDQYDLSIKAPFTSNCMVNVADEFDVDFELALSNKNLLTRIQSMEEGKTARIFIDGKGIAKAEFFQAIQGKDKTLVFYNDNYQWVFNGQTVTTAKDVQLKITFSMVDGSAYGTDNQLLQLDFAANGELPGPANVRIKSDYTYEIFEMTESMYLYYLNPTTNELDYEKDSHIEYLLDGSDHWCQFDITHNSTYMVSGKKIGETKKPVKVTKVTITGPSKKLAAGKKMQLSATIKPDKATNKKVTWKSSNTSFATINSKGVVTAKKAGIGKKVTITATAKDGSKINGKYTITIMKDSVKSIKLSASKKAIKAGNSIKIKAVIKTTGAKANKTLAWTSSNKKYATVNKSGKVTAKKAGKGKTVTITARSTDGSNKKATIKIKIR